MKRPAQHLIDECDSEVVEYIKSLENNETGLKMIINLLDDMVPGLNAGEFEKEWMQSRLNNIMNVLEDE